MIEVEQLGKRFGPVNAVRDLSFKARNGAITGLLGSNGAGKTTALRIIAGILKPQHGHVQIDGFPAHEGPSGARERIGALLDHTGLYGRLTARENLAYFGQLHGIPQTRLHRRVAEVLTLLRLESIADRRTAGFSQGERMKVALGRAIIHSPGNLLLDEPTNGLDIPTVHSLRSLLKRMRDEGTCVIFSSHVLEEVRELCDDLVVISKGRIAARGTPQELCRQAGTGTLEDAFLRFTTQDEATIC